MVLNPMVFIAFSAGIKAKMEGKQPNDGTIGRVVLLTRNMREYISLYLYEDLFMRCCKTISGAAKRGSQRQGARSWLVKISPGLSSTSSEPTTTFNTPHRAERHRFRSTSSCRIQTSIRTAII